MDSRYRAWAARWRVPLGFVLGVAYLTLSRPTFPLVLAGGTVAAVGLVIRGFAAGCLDKNTQLATGGPYARTRNPLYLGSALLGLGFGIAGGSWGLGAASLAFFLLVYWPVMQREEEFLRRQFGESYNQYAAQVPLFFPALSRRETLSREKFRWGRYRKNREYEAALGVAAGLVFLLLKIELR
jgi:protein-S-isoprenylcysteine O-methyltransferase Ste14